jgi:6-pyruvoyltetrahydropterin/6-carboxytetrahydropterin synthase
MIVAKQFKWEAAHRIQWHEGKCKHLHGHSYKMIVEFDGSTNANGVVIDFNDIKKIVAPYIELIDHATIIAANDQELIAIFESKKWKYFLLPYDTTAENLCKYFLDLIIHKNKELLTLNNIKEVGIKIYETETAYAYVKAAL